MKNYIKPVVISIFLSAAFIAQGQTESPADSIPSKQLNTVIIHSYGDKKQSLPDVSGVNIFSGKKTEVIPLRTGEANLSQNLGRMIFAKIPGIHNWDMDGAGTQMNIGTRGTDAHRSIEMNMRQNGYNTNSDIFGYPENHYTVPMEGVQQVQLVRGSAALQFGSQFGGMMNYLMKEGDSAKVIAVESEQTHGSNNFFNSFNAFGGSKGKINYYAYYDNRSGDGYRPNSAFNYKAYYADFKYSFNEKGAIAFQFSRMDYRQQIAGGLTDAQFAQDARQSNRSRNFFSPKINIPAMILNYALSPQTHIQLVANGIWGERSSVQFINTPNVEDTINTTTGLYNNRQVDRDFYNGLTIEARLMHQYRMGSTNSVLSGGIRYFNERTRRRQKGVGTTGSDFDFTLTAPYGIDLKFHTLNYAVFAENIFQVTHRFSITPGFRYEIINSDLNGFIDNATFPVSYKSQRSFPLFGVGLQYNVNDLSQLYGNISQAYRPFLYANITPANQVGVIDPNLKDSRGYDIDAGYRGQVADVLNFDAGIFYLFCGDRIGKLTLNGSDDASYIFTTNTGNSVAKGAEIYINLSLLKLLGVDKNNTDLRLFNSLAYTHARYTSGEISNGAENISLEGNQVEGAPDWINHAGIEFQYRGISTTCEMSYVSKQFNDANNTVFNATGATGIVPSYALMDWAFDWSFRGHYHFSGGINNMANVKYFSRRINMYPGPGILPGDGRTFYISLGCKI